MQGLRGSVNCSMHCCSVETVPMCPGEGLYALGMYELNEETNLRIGALALYNRNTLISSRPMKSGVLDMKFHGPLLACALSSGDVEILSINEEMKDFSSQEPLIKNPDEGLALSLDWNKSEDDDVRLAVSTQEGSVLVYDLLPTGFIESSALRHVHTLFGERVPAWITAFNPHNSQIVMSGGDDCCLRLWDLRCPSNSVHKVSNFFTAGVTSSQWCPYNSHPNIYAVGSYDGSIAIWDERMCRPKPLTSIDSGGGVWRLKWMPEINCSTHHQLFLGAACMHNGSGIYEINPGSKLVESDMSITTVETLIDSNEERLVYGFDWLISSGTEKSIDITEDLAKSQPCSIHYEIVTCSFYDNLVQLWSNDIHRMTDI